MPSQQREHAARLEQMPGHRLHVQQLPLPISLTLHDHTISGPVDHRTTPRGFFSSLLARPGSRLGLEVGGLAEPARAGDQHLQPHLTADDRARRDLGAVGCRRHRTSRTWVATAPGSRLPQRARPGRPPTGRPGEPRTIAATTPSAAPEQQQHRQARDGEQAGRAPRWSRRHRVTGRLLGGRDRLGATRVTAGSALEEPTRAGHPADDDGGHLTAAVVDADRAAGGRDLLAPRSAAAPAVPRATRPRGLAGGVDRPHLGRARPRAATPGRW